MKKRIHHRENAGVYFDFVEKLYEFLAAKISFSAQLADELIGNQILTLERNSRQLIEQLKGLKTLYYDLWFKQYKPEGVFYNIMKFNHIQERFEYLLYILKNTENVHLLRFKLEHYSTDHIFQSICFSDLFNQ